MHLIASFVYLLCLQLTSFVTEEIDSLRKGDRRVHFLDILGRAAHNCRKKTLIQRIGATYFWTCKTFTETSMNKQWFGSAKIGFQCRKTNRERNVSLTDNRFQNTKTNDISENYQRSVEFKLCHFLQALFVSKCGKTNSLHLLVQVVTEVLMTEDQQAGIMGKLAVEASSTLAIF